jgi:SLOG in TRPM, prokaryote
MNIERKVIMYTQKIIFSDRHTLCVFPNQRSEIAQATSELQLEGSYPVIVLIGGDIDEHQALQTIARLAEDIHAVMICGGTNMGVMAEIGQIRWQRQYKFPLVGVAPRELVAWPGGQRNTKFLWWGKQRWQLAPHYSHFMLVPGSEFGAESPWIVDVATSLSKGRKSVTILINGGEISRKDIELSLANGRPVIALSRTGRLADELAQEPNRDKLITIVPANAEQRIIEVVQTALSIDKKNVPTETLKVNVPQTV